MKHWPAKKVQTKIAENNAVKIRSALAVSINPRTIAREFKKSNPVFTGNVTEDRLIARAWANLNVVQDLAPLKRMIEQTRIEGYVTGLKAANHSIKQAAMALKQVSISDIVLDPDADVWDNWKPGDVISAELLEREYGLDLLLQQSGVSIREIKKTSIDRIGNRLADGMRKGLSVDKIAESLRDDVADPARALMIAMTETTRAAMFAAQERYAEANIEKIQWSAMDPCPKCALNDGQIVKMGQKFASGDYEPPAHPNCLCSLLPVIEEQKYEEVEAEVSAAAANLLAESKSRELDITEDLVDIQRALGEKGLEPSFSGLRYRLKKRGSLERKIRDEFAKGEAGSVAGVAEKISDAVRYTYVWDNERYVEGIEATLDELQKLGFGTRVKNYWARDDYKGINVAVTDDKGGFFELQFHTNSSVEVKEELHGLYEQYRVAKDDRERWLLWNRMTRVAKRVETPGNVGGLMRIGVVKQEYFTDARGVARFGNSGTLNFGDQG